MVHLQNGVIREGTSGETSTIPLVGIPNGALHSQVREYPSRSRKRQREGTAGEAEGFEAGIGASGGGKEQETQEGGRGQKRGRAEEQERRSERVAKAMRQAGAAASGMARAAARAVWTMLGRRHVEETAEKSGPPRAGDHGEPGEAATGDG